MLPGRSAVARPTNESELRTTLVLRLPIEEASAKVRAGGPIDDDEDMDLPVWAGVVPLRLIPAPPSRTPSRPSRSPSPVVRRCCRTG